MAYQRRSRAAGTRLREENRNTNDAHVGTSEVAGEEALPRSRRDIVVHCIPPSVRDRFGTRGAETSTRRNFDDLNYPSRGQWWARRIRIFDHHPSTIVRGKLVEDWAT